MLSFYYEEWQGGNACPYAESFHRFAMGIPPQAGTVWVEKHGKAICLACKAVWPDKGSRPRRPRGDEIETIEVLRNASSLTWRVPKQYSLSNVIKTLM